MITHIVNRTLNHHNTLRILCQAFQIEFEGHDHRCERVNTPGAVVRSAVFGPK